MQAAARREDAPSADHEWVQDCARVLRRRWPSVPEALLEEAAAELLGDPALRALAPREAAERWLAPVLR